MSEQTTITPSRAVLITGMHRSGTSMVAKTLRSAGIELGPEESLIAGDAANIDGYWENREVVGLHDELLRRLGGSWESPPQVEPSWHTDPTLHDLRERALQITSSLCPPGGTWAWKDPRGSLTLPFWLDLFPDARIVLCVRNPVEVAKSLHHRSYLSKWFSMRLWQRYNDQVLADAPPDQLAVTHYDAWFTDGPGELQRVLHALGLEMTEEAAAAALEAAKPEHRHQSATDEAFLSEPPPAGVATLYDSLCRVAGMPVPITARLAARVESLQETETQLRLAVEEAERRAATTARQRDALHEELVAVRALAGEAADASQTELHATHERLGSLLGELAAAKRVATTRSSEVVELRAALEEREAELQTMRAVAGAVDVPYPAADENEPLNTEGQAMPKARPIPESQELPPVAPAESNPATTGENNALAAALQGTRQRHEDYTQAKARLRDVVEASLPDGAVVAVASRGDDELLSLGNRTSWHFPAADDGRWIGFHPRDDESAIEMLEAMRAKGGQYLAFPSTAAWWLDHYAGFTSYLEDRYRVLHHDAGAVLFDVRSSSGAAAARPFRDKLQERAAETGRLLQRWRGRIGRQPAPGGDRAVPPSSAASPASAPAPMRAAIEAAPPAHEVEMVRRSGLIDVDYYCSAYPTVCASDGETDPVEHFCVVGWRERKNPNAYFDTDWYLRTHGSTMTNPNPLVDYIAAGETKRPCPLFDPGWYAGTYRNGNLVGALAEYLARHRRREWRSPNEYFDVDFYQREYPDVHEAGVDPVLHYLYTGHLESRNPSQHFWTDYYRRAHLAQDAGVNPLVYHCEVGCTAGLSTEPAGDPAGRLHAEVRHWVGSGPAFEELDRSIARDAEKRVKAVAFYLPQFHAFAENDEWWGKGFTEWRNLSRGMPRYVGHYQPRVPRDLGFYDLSDPRTMRRQVEMALDAGLHGFGFYYYWFNGKRLLHQPLDHFLDDRTLDINFCVIWANENWTRRWDGREQEVLIRQDYDPSTDPALVDDLQRYFADPRYIRINGRPLFVIYRMDIIPGGAAAVARWRELWRDRHGEDPLIFVAHAFGASDPAKFAADGAIEFPPHKLTAGLRTIDHQLEMLDPAFSGWVFDYLEVVAESLTEPHPDYPLIKTAVPSWDNDARRQGSSTVLHGSRPALYEEWMRNLVTRAEEHPVFGESFVFINAWNEWAEGAYLEPDVHYGAAYLNATARAICGPSESAGQRRKVLLVGHDAHPHGAQINLWHMGDMLRNQFGCQVAFLLADGGELVKDYENLGRTTVAADPGSLGEVIRGLNHEGFTLALVNSVASGHITTPLREAGFRIVSLVHELPKVLAEYNLTGSLAAMASCSDYVVVAAEAVKKVVERAAGPDAADIVVRPQGVYRPITPSAAARSTVRDELGIPHHHRIVLNLGFGDLRKGIDTFIQTAHLARRDHEELHFVWVGKLHSDVMRWLELDLTDEVRSNLHFIDFTEDIGRYYSAADVFFLTSREDPFPSVVLEALSAGLPVVGFADSGGTEELIRQHGRVVKRADPESTVQALVRHAYEDDPASVQARTRTIEDNFRFDDYCFFLLQLLDPEIQKVSVVVPNYNYESHLARRLETVFGQSYPVFEIIVLDDASCDGSLQELDRIRRRSRRKFDVIVNAENSGSVFRQWELASGQARGDYLWIAEADDLSKPGFLERLLPRIHECDADLGFTDSSTIDEAGRPLGPSYKDYYREAVGPLLDEDLVLDGNEFVRRCLLERNLVLNVSAVLWRRRALEKAIATSVEELSSFRLAGDWFLYAEVALTSPFVVYISEPLNVHRRHSGGVTASLHADRHVGEIRRVHEALFGRLMLSPDERQRMSDYEEGVRAQLSL